MKNYDILYAEDVPHYGTVVIEASSPEEAIEIAKSYDYSEVFSEPEWSNAVSKRIVNIEDDDGNIIEEDLNLDGTVLLMANTSQKRLHDAAPDMLDALTSLKDAGYLEDIYQPTADKALRAINRAAPDPEEPPPESSYQIMLDTLKDAKAIIDELQPYEDRGEDQHERINTIRETIAAAEGEAIK